MNRGAPGLSLLETLVALALMALIATALSGTLRLALGGHERSLAASADAPARAYRVQLRRWLAQRTERLD